MKKLFFFLIIVSLISCTASKITKSREQAYKESYNNIKRWVDQFEKGKITKVDLNLLILGQEDYLKYFARVKKRK